MLDVSEKSILLGIADGAIRKGLFSENLIINRSKHPPPLFEWGASFVTLHINEQLRGCIGSLEARQPLIEDVAENAYAAAFRDPRFPPLAQEEYDHLDVHISVLTKPVTITVAHEEELLRTLRPNIDGLIIREGAHRATFLPTVWRSLPKPEDFLRQLKLKAGLPENYWSKTLLLQVYNVEEFSAAK